MAQKREMKDLLVEELRDIYSAEKQALRAYPKLIRAATSDKLKDAFRTHSEQTENQIERLQQAFEKLGVSARAKMCHAMEGLVEEAKEVIDEGLAPELLDAALVGAAQKMEHYEIASYGTVRAYAEALGETEVAKLLEETLAEEKQTDELLNKIAVGDINKRAIKAA